jgi:hypothetical protein
MAKLKCKAHNRRVHVLKDGQGTLTVHREDGSKCVVNPVVYIMGQAYLPIQVAEWDGPDYHQDTINYLPRNR